METGHRKLGPLTRAVNSGSGNRALLSDNPIDFKPELNHGPHE